MRRLHRAEDRFQAASGALEAALGHAADPAVQTARQAASDPGGRLFAEVCAAEEAEAGLRGRIGAVRAATLAGVAAKARVSLRFTGPGDGADTPAGELRQATLELLPDLAALAGEAV